MPTRRPSFNIVSSTLAALAVFGVFVQFASKFLPLPRLNDMQSESAEFLYQASRQEIRWRTMGPGALRDARREDKPLMLVMGSASSFAGRLADRALFSDPDVSMLLNRQMVCVRIDLDRNPEWTSVILPLTRASSELRPDFQIWFFTPGGALFDAAAFDPGLEPPDPQLFLRRLSAIVGRYRDESKEGSGPRLDTQQAAEAEQLSSGSFAQALDVASIESAVVTATSRRVGGSIVGNRVELRGSALQLLLRRGNARAFRACLDPMLKTPIVDWLEGGFFAAISTEPMQRTEFDKKSLANAEQMWALAAAGAILGNRVYERVAQRTFDFLDHGFQSGGLIAAARIGDEGPLGRSARSSFSPRAMRELLPPEDREWLRKTMTMRVEENRLMSMSARDPLNPIREEARLDSIAEKLLTGRVTKPRYAGLSQLDVNGYVTARMWEVSRIWGSVQATEAAARHYDLLDFFRAGDDVKHTLLPDSPQNPYLGDYLAYADAALAAFLATGHTEELRKGLRVMLRARELFAPDDPATWNVWLSDPSQHGLRISNIPDPLDQDRESLLGQSVRLAWAYGTVCLGADTRSDPVWALSRPLRGDARMIVAKYAGLATTLGIRGAGFANAAILSESDVSAFAVGPDAAAMAAALYRMNPLVLASPAVGEVRRDLQRRGQGFYVLQRGVVSGPLTLEQASSALASAVQSSAGG
jgi:uncharacterized protein YyaL (SSP411 family)